MPKVTNVASLPVIMPALCSPMNVINSPMPGEMALRNCRGMASTILLRKPLSVSRTKMMPSMNTAVRANCQL